jgi:hypothetical protein
MSGFETWKSVTKRETALQSDDSGLLPVNALTLNSPAALATNCVLIGHCDKADVVWTGTEFRALCEHMLNGNSQTNFVLVYRDHENRPKFAKANHYANRSWDTIRGRAKRKVGIGFIVPMPNEGSSRTQPINSLANSAVALLNSAFSKRLLSILQIAPPHAFAGFFPSLKRGLSFWRSKHQRQPA